MASGSFIRSRQVLLRNKILTAVVLLAGTASGLRLSAQTLTAAANSAYLGIDQVAVGSLITIYGEALADSMGSPATLPGPTSLLLKDGTRMSFFLGSRILELRFWSPGQVNVAVPSDLEAGSRVVVRAERMLSSGAVLNSILEAGLWVRSQAPGVFSLRACPAWESAQCAERLKLDRAILTDAAGNLVTLSRPAESGSIYQVWLTGLGTLENRAGLGFAKSQPYLFLNREQPSASGGLEDVSPAVEVQGIIHFAGSSGQVPGLDQINLEIPPLGIRENCKAGDIAEFRIELVPADIYGNPASSNYVYLPLRISARDCI